MSTKHLDECLLAQIDNKIDEGGGWAAIKDCPGGSHYIWSLIEQGLFEEDGGYIRRVQ
jgi:hypothetical protein